MGAYQRGTVWYSTPGELRHRKHVGLTMSPEAIEALAYLAEEAGTSRSALVEQLVTERLHDLLRRP